MYRQIGLTSTVDESLFGGPNDSHDLSRSKRRTVTGPIAPSAAVVSLEELRRIQNSSIILTDADIAAEKERQRLLKEEKQKRSKERKDRMRELEKRSAMLAKKSDFEIAEEAKKQALRESAGKQVDKNYDAVKLLDSMAQRAIAFTIRDQQLIEKKRLEQVEKEFDERMNMLIEIDRIKDIERREAEEKAKRAKRINDRTVINDQIAERERFRMLQLEAREQENQAMRQLMERYKDEDEAAAAKRRIEQEKSRIAVVKANEEAIRRKKEAREAEKREMEDILLYQAQKDAELAKREEEEAEIARAKKERQAKLLAQQEKAQNNAGKLDELRARRAAEEKERAERRKEKADAKKRKEDMKELLESRARQAADKLERQKAMKKQQEEELLLDLQYTTKMDERERREREAKIEKANEFRTSLMAQIDDRARARRNMPRDGDGSNIREELIREEAKLSAIRDRMVQDLEAQGVNSKYLSEMKNVDIGKILRR